MLPRDLLVEMREMVRSGLAKSSSSLVREAVQERLKELREQRLQGEFEAAAKDPLFMADLAGTMAAFRAVDAESARFIPD